MESRMCFKSLGALVVPGGQTMNPSTKDLLQAVESVVSEKVIVLPNNKNIVLTAGQVHNLTNKTVKVIPTKTVPRGWLLYWHLTMNPILIPIPR